MVLARTFSSAASTSSFTSLVARVYFTRKPASAAAVPRPMSRMCLPGARWAEQDDVACLGEEPARGQGGDVSSDAGLGVPIEVLEGLGSGEPCRPDPQLSTRGVAGADFAFQDRCQVVLERPARVPGLVSQPGRGLGDPGCLESSSQVVQLLDRLSRVLGCLRRRRHGCLRRDHQPTSSPLTSPKARS